MIVTLVILCIALLLALVIACIVIYRLAKQIFVLEDSIEEALDALDQRYKTLCTVLEVPVASDDLMTRSVINEIKMARETILIVADKLMAFTLVPTRQGGDDDDE